MKKLLFLFLFLFLPNVVQGATWYDNAWKYRAEINVTNNSSSTVTEFPITLNIDSLSLILAGQLQSNCEDYRILATDNVTLMPQYLNDDTCFSTSTILHFKLDSIPALANKKYYLYYGNSIATSSWDWDGVFLPYSDYQLANQTPPLSRFGHGSVYWNNKFWIFGGNLGGTSYQNDVWNSDDGITWTQITASASWAVRSNFATLIFENKVWVIGGRNVGGKLNDVWYTSDGANWTQATSDAGWPIRSSLGYATLNNQMYILGGFGADYYNDVWSSSDGVNWVNILPTSTSPWTKRTGPNVTVYNNQMHLTAGINGSTYLTDEWSSYDGITWTQNSASVAFPTRQGATSGVAFDRMWITGGFAGSGVYRSDLWYSSDGATWIEAVTTTFGPRQMSAMVSTDDKFLLTGGTTTTVLTGNSWQLLRPYLLNEPTENVVFVSLGNYETVPVESTTMEDFINRYYTEIIAVGASGLFLAIIFGTIEIIIKMKKRKYGN